MYENHSCMLFLLLQTDSFLVTSQSVSVVDQEKVDKLMLDMDGTENKCKLFFFLPS